VEKISLAILNFNQASRIDRAIRSCQNQFRTSFELEIIVVDDGSTDDSLSILAEFEHEITLLSNPVNLGVGACSRIAFESHSGTYFMRVDADDFLSPISCSTLLLALSTNLDLSFAYADHYRVNEKGFKQELINLDDFDKLVRHGAGVLYRSRDIELVGGFDESLRNCEDMDLLFRLQKEGKQGIRVPLPLYRYYQHDSNISRSEEQKESERKLRNKYGI
jgi:glycosyltransferase involved in cell wall biosynthesis